MSWSPSERAVTTSVACPFTTVAVPIRAPSSKNVTVPVSPEPVVGKTVAVKVTDWPAAEGLTEVSRPRVVAALLTVIDAALGGRAREEARAATVRGRDRVGAHGQRGDEHAGRRDPVSGRQRRGAERGPVVGERDGPVGGCRPCRRRHGGGEGDALPRRRGGWGRHDGCRGGHRCHVLDQASGRGREVGVAAVGGRDAVRAVGAVGHGARHLQWWGRREWRGSGSWGRGPPRR